MTTKTKRAGRRAGGSNRAGFYFLSTTTRKGWYASDGPKIVRLTDDSGRHIKDKRAVDQARAAYGRFQEDRAERERLGETGPAMLVGEVCRQYVESIKTLTTKGKRDGFLYDFCSGYPARFAKGLAEPTAADRLHKGYGNLTVKQIIVKDIHDWCDAHAGWGDSGGKRAGIQAVKRAFRWAVEMQLIKTNPLDGLRNKRSRSRVTFITPEQEAAMLKYARPAVAQMIKVCIRTGARFGCEFAKLKDWHVQETPRGMIWVFPAEESKTRKKPRTILVPEDIAEIVRKEMEDHDGAVFRNASGKPWTLAGIKSVFRSLLGRCRRKAGIEFDSDICPYSMRHTYAKRTLGGYWTGRPASIEQLCGLMGNSRQVAWETYAQWCDAYSDPLWAAVG